MSGAKHTPGPWTTDWGFILAARADGRDNYIAETVKSDEEGLYIEDAAEREANSHLLAAAPQLLEAAQAALAVMVDTELDEYFDQGRIEQALKLLREAITEAGAVPRAKVPS